jgi:hypothetical protein
MFERELVDPSRPITSGLVLETLASSVAVYPVQRVLPWLLIGVTMTAFVVVALMRTIRATSPPRTRSRVDGPTKRAPIRRSAPGNPGHECRR